MSANQEYQAPEVTELGDFDEVTAAFPLTTCIEPYSPYPSSYQHCGK